MTSSLRTHGFTKEHDALLARGWPELRILTDEPVTPKKAASEAIKGIWAVDPYFQVGIPREIARRYLRIYGAQKTGVTLESAAEDPGGIDRAWLDVVMERRMAPSSTLEGGGETYAFRLAEVVYLFEAFLGTEVVVAAIAKHMLGALKHPEWWGKFPDNEAEEVPRLAWILGWLRLRMDAARFDELVAPLGKPERRLPVYSSLLHLLTDRGSPLSPGYGDVFAAQRRDAAWIAASDCEDWPSFSFPTQTITVGGADLLFRGDSAKLTRLPKWEQLRILREIGSLRHPGAARAIGALLVSRSTGAQAKAWVSEKREWLEREALPVLDEKDAASSAAIRATLEGKEPPPRKSKKDLERELRKAVDDVEPSLVAAKGDAKAERAVLEQTFRTYCEIRAALGEIMPDADFTHTIGERKWKAKRAQLVRWMDLAVKVANGDPD